jgi:hypothetical protein
VDYLFIFLKPLRIPVKGFIRAGILCAVLAGCNTFDFQISQECGEFANEIQGTVRDGTTRQPITDAEVVVRSRGVGNCPNSRPIDEVRIVTDELGNFFQSVFIFSDDQLEVEVSAPGCDTFTREDVTYRDFVSSGGTFQGMLVELNCGGPAAAPTSTP